MTIECDVLVGGESGERRSLTFATLPRLGEFVLLGERHTEAGRYRVIEVVHVAAGVPGGPAVMITVE